MINVNDLVRVVNVGATYERYNTWIKVNKVEPALLWSPRNLPSTIGTFKVLAIHKHQYSNEFLAYIQDTDFSTCYIVGIDGLELVQPVVTFVKPRIRTLSSGRRQFDVTFKKLAVRKLKEIRTVKDWGGISRLVRVLKISHYQLRYWEQQFDQGHFSPERAVAFSRKPTMIHG